MKKIISFEKKIDFPSMIGEITSISLDHTIKFIDGSNASGEFIVSGSYKMTEASRVEEKFTYNVPVEIILTERLDVGTCKVEIDDFYYEIENDDTLVCMIDVLVEGVEALDMDESDDFLDQKNHIDCGINNRECDGDIINNYSNSNNSTNNINISTVDDNKKIDDVEVPEENNDNTNNNNKGISLFDGIDDTEETYSTYSVYILREEETVTSLINKYKTSKEELESYNDLSNIGIGSKIIIPYHSE